MSFTAMLGVNLKKVSKTVSITALNIRALIARGLALRSGGEVLLLTRARGWRYLGYQYQLRIRR